MARVLVIDDEAGVRQMIAALLSAVGYDVRQAADGHEGETLAETFVPDVAIVDIVMPRREGLKTIQAWRRGWPSLKILAILRPPSRSARIPGNSAAFRSRWRFGKAFRSDATACHARISSTARVSPASLKGSAGHPSNFGGRGRAGGDP